MNAEQTTYLIGVILVMSLATFATRLIPFVLLRNRRDHPLLEFLGIYTPPVIMTLLVLYSLKDMNLASTPYGAPELIAVAITALFHLARGNALLSIFSGTGAYMLFLQTGLFT